VDIGNYLPLYFAAGMDTTNISADFALLGRNSHVMALAMTEYVVTCEACRKEFSDTGIIFLGSGSSDVYGLLTTTPVRTAEDLQGLRLRSGGAPYSRWAEHFGATGVAMGVGDTFEGISQGTIDGTMASVVDMLSYRLIDVVKYITRIPIGTYHVTSNFTVAKSTWDSLSEQEKAWVVAAAARANFDLTDRWAYQLPAEAWEAIEGTDIEVIEPDPAFLEASNAFIAEDEASRVAEAGAMGQHFVDLVEKWTAIVDEVGEDPDALAERAKEEIWSKVDWSTYGN
jgi:TRAP-type C4-dicarboxylate transport system substrate-binding protein